MCGVSKKHSLLKTAKMSLQTINFLSTKHGISELIHEVALSNLSALKSDFLY